jgi:hypothetical protein
VPSAPVVSSCSVGLPKGSQLATSSPNAVVVMKLTRTMGWIANIMNAV